MEKTLSEPLAVTGAGKYWCEYRDCEVTQTEEDTGDILFYHNSGEGMFCKEHVKLEDPYQNLK